MIKSIIKIAICTCVYYLIAKCIAGLYLAKTGQVLPMFNAWQAVIMFTVIEIIDRVF